MHLFVLDRRACVNYVHHLHVFTWILTFLWVMNMLRMGNSGSWSRHVTGWRTWLHSGEQIERNCNDIGTLSDSSKSRIQDTINKCRTEKMLYWHSNFCVSACCISLINIAGCDMCVICLSLVWHCLGVSRSTGAELRDRVLTQTAGTRGPGHGNIGG